MEKIIKFISLLISTGKIIELIFPFLGLMYFFNKKTIDRFILFLGISIVIIYPIIIMFINFGSYYSFPLSLYFIKLVGYLLIIYFLICKFLLDLKKERIKFSVFLISNKHKIMILLLGLFFYLIGFIRSISQQKSTLNVYVSTKILEMNNINIFLFVGVLINLLALLTFVRKK